MASQDLSARIVAAALEQFGRLGFDGASTRDIARAAGTAMSSITYHFGGKQGLYVACADHIAEIVAENRRPVVEAIAADPPTSPEAARAALIMLIENLGRLMLSPRSATFAQFIVREQQHPTEAFERLYARMMRPVLETALLLIDIARPSLADAERRALLANAVGMALVLRLARATVSRIMQVETLDEATADLLLASLRCNALSLLKEPAP